MMIEMAGDKGKSMSRDSRIGLPLSIVSRTDKKRSRFCMTRERIDMFRPLEARQRRPFRLGLARGGDSGVDVLRRALRNARNAVAARGVEDIGELPSGLVKKLR